MNVLDLFSGFGGFSYGLESVGFTTVAFCETDDYAKQVLKKHWPKIPIYDDIKTLTKKRLETDGLVIDVISGGWPCQPVSRIGKRKGSSDDRYLWPEMFRLIKSIRPRWVIGENVIGIVEMELDQVLIDLESIGYTTATFDLPAASVGANHERRRIFVIASPKEDVANAVGTGLQGQQRVCISQWEKTARHDWSGHRWMPSPRIYRRSDGLPKKMERLKGLGNSVCPALVAEIGRAILNVEGKR